MDNLAVIQSAETIRELREISDSVKILVTDFKELVKETNKVNNSFKAGRPQDYADAMANLRDVTQQFTAIERQLAEALQRTARLETQQARTAAEQARARREAAAAFREESRARQEATREQQRNERQTRENTSAHARLTREVREARNRARDFGAEMLNLTRAYRNGELTQREYRSQLGRLSRDFSSANRQALELERQLTRLNRATTGNNGSLVGRVTDILKAAGIINIVENIASSFYRLGEAALQTSVKLDSLRLAQNSVFKTQENVGKQNEFLTGIAERYGIEILGLTDAYTKFAASAQGTFLEGTKTQEIFDSVTRSSSLLGVSTDETTGILRALGQMMSKGKVQAEELRGQLGDRMAGAFKLFADGMGVSTAQLDKMLKDGEVLADDVLPKFAAQLNKKYKLDLTDQIETQTASINRRTNAWVAFVEGVNSGSGVMTKSLLGFNNALTNMLEALTPSKKITIIEQEQAQLNILGIELRKNFNDQKKRKEILDQIIALNPYFLDGLDRENLTLKDIGIQLKNVNEQYVQKIVLEKQQEKINSLLEDQAQSYIYLNRVFTENAVAYNNMNEATKKTLEEFKSGTLDYFEAQNRIEKSTKSFSKENRVATDMLFQMNAIIAQGSFNFEGYNRGIDGNRKALKEASKEYNDLIKFTNTLIGANGQLVNSNGLLATSFNSVGKAAQDRKKYFDEILGAAERQGQKFALVNNVFREKVNGKWITTNKKETEGWYILEGKLIQRQKIKIEKTEKAKASSLTSSQKDYLKDLQANRDIELAINEKRYTEGKIDEIKYLDGNLRIKTNFFKSEMSYLKGKNAEERKRIADANLDQLKLEKETQKKKFEIRSKILDENYKKEVIEADRRAKFFDNSDFYDGSGRLESEIALNEERIESAKAYYSNLIDIAKKANQDTLEIERKRDDEIGNLQDARTAKVRSRVSTLVDDLNIQSETITNAKILSVEEQRSLILSNKKLTNSEREYQLSILERQNQIELNNLEIVRLNALKDKLSAKEFLTQEDEKQISEFIAQIKVLENANIELNLDIKNDISDKLQKTLNIIKDGLTNLGLENTANAFDAMFKEIKAGTADWADYMNTAFSLVGDFALKYIDKQKESRISALDEELKLSQENTEQEISFIDGRLEQLNALEELTAEQMQERNRLEDESRTYREQQQQREKMIAIQKAKAEQRAAAQQALINGALAATTTLAQLGFIAGAIPAALALAFGIAQSVSISSKDPVPQYFVGTSNAKRGWALTNERGAEIHTDKNDNIKSLGTNRGAVKTWMDAGDKVYTASETSSILKKVGGIPKVGENIFQKIALNSLKSPEMPILVSQNNIDYDKLGSVVAEKYEKIIKAYDKPIIERVKGKIIKHSGRNLPQVIGTYDLITLEEKYSNDSN